jgi:MoaA/NifB/PqqE/SkfB family radical SAM enzyme
VSDTQNHNRIEHKLKDLLIKPIRVIRKAIVKPVPFKNKELEKKTAPYNSQRFYGPQKYFCYAPFSSMFISYNGRVSPCYACKAEDSIKDKSLAEIWNGEIFRMLRNKLKQGIIPDECKFCRDHVISENYGSVLAGKYDHYLSSSDGKPVIAELELGNNCNLECIMCSGNLSSSIRKNRENLPVVISSLPLNFTEQFIPFIRHLKTIEFTGGDPFLIPVYYKLWDAIEVNHPKLDLLITTNANTMDSNVRSLMEKGLKLSFNISIDSLQSTNYHVIRRNGSLDNAMANIEIFSDYTKKHNTSLGFLVCPLRENWKELPEFVPFANKYNAMVSYHVVFKPAQHALWSLSDDKLDEIAKYLDSFKFSGNTFYSNINVENYGALVTLIKSWAANAKWRKLKNENQHKELLNIILKAKEKLHQSLVQKGKQNEFDYIESLVSSMNFNNFPELVYVVLAQKGLDEILSALNDYTEDELKTKLRIYHEEIYFQYLYEESLGENKTYLS